MSPYQILSCRVRIATRPVLSSRASVLLHHRCSKIRSFRQLAPAAKEGQTNAAYVRPSLLDRSGFRSSKNKVEEIETLRITDVEAHHVGHIRMIELNRGMAKNALSKQMVAELSNCVEEIYEETSAGQTRALIVASASDDVYCAGADLKERKTMSEDETQDFLTSLRSTFTRIAQLPIPTIACVSGAALGGGLELALCCHLRVFSENAVVGLPETRLAIIPGAGGTYRLAQAIGLSHAREMILTGRRVGYFEAAKLGLCHRLAERGEADGSGAENANIHAKSVALQLAQEISRGGPVAIRAALEALRGRSREAENAAYDTILKTQDRTEALSAFAEKRTPNFRGE